MSQVNTELGKSATATISLNDSAVRSLFGKASGTISLSDGYGKSSATISLAALDSAYGANYPGFTASAYINFYANGTYDDQFGTKNWYSPTTTGIGSSYWIRFTQTASQGTTTLVGSGTGSWLQLSASRSIGVTKTTNGYGERTFTVEISTNSSGTNIVASKTGVVVAAEIIF